MTQIADGRPREVALTTYRDTDDRVAKKAIERTYAELLHGNVEMTPTKEIRIRARGLLDGYELHHPPLGLGMRTGA